MAFAFSLLVVGCSDDSDNGGSSGASGSVSCAGAGHCDSTAGELCCARSDSNGADVCAASCVSDGVEFACDTPDDCPNGDCCGNITDGWTCGGCSPPDDQLACDTSDDCYSDAPCCLPVTINDKSLSLCVTYDGTCL